MIKKNKIVSVLILATTALSAYAQNPTANPVSVTITQSSPAVAPSGGNVYEKEVTPLLRDISKKKSILELRKLDRELEKIDEETMKSQIERDKLSNPAIPAGLAGLNNNNLPFTPQVFPPGVLPSPQAQSGGATPAAVPDEMRVIMIYGYDTNLFAKVAMGAQGGYVVKAGDILPDGRKVSSISPNFIEVTKVKKSGKEKIFVSGAVMPAAASNAAQGGNASSVLTTIPAPQPQLMQIPAAGAATGTGQGSANMK